MFDCLAFTQAEASNGQVGYSAHDNFHTLRMRIRGLHRDTRLVGTSSDARRYRANGRANYSTSIDYTMSLPAAAAERARTQRLDVPEEYWCG